MEGFCKFSRVFRKAILKNMPEFDKFLGNNLLNGFKVRVYFGKNIKKSTCAAMIRIIITFSN